MFEANAKIKILTSLRRNILFGVSALTCVSPASAQQVPATCPDSRAPVGLAAYVPLSGNGPTAVHCVGAANDSAYPGAVNAAGDYYSNGQAGIVANVANGSTAAGSTDATNGGQLNSAASSVASALGGGASFNSAAGVISSPSYSVQGTSYNNVGAAISRIDTALTQLQAVRFDLAKLDRARQAGDARNAALSGLPQVMTPGRGLIGASMGGSGDAVAFAFGMSKSFADERTIAKAAASFATRTKELTWNVGAGYEF